MATWIRALKWTALATAINAWTLTPLMGFFVGDKRPSAAATALMMMLSAVQMSAAVMLAAVDRYRRRSARAAEIQRRAVARAVGRNPDDRFAAQRAQAHAAGLPWIESDGTVSWPVQSSEVAR